VFVNGGGKRELLDEVGVEFVDAGEARQLGLEVEEPEEGFILGDG
jgi:hypothetical protein